MLDWLRQAVGLPDHFAGVIQDSASTATLAAVVTMGERALQWQGNQRGLAAHVPRSRLHVRSRCTPRSTARSGSPASVRSTSCEIPVDRRSYAEWMSRRWRWAINRDRDAGLTAGRRHRLRRRHERRFDR